MKKRGIIIIAVILVVAIAAFLIFNNTGKKPAGIGIALITDVGNIDDQSFNQGTWEGIVAYAEAEKLVKDVDYAYFRPSEDSDTARIEEITNAIEKGAKIVVLPGYLFDTAVVDLAAKNEGVMFLGVDLTPANNYTANINNIAYNEEIAGFCAGYAAVKDGYTKLGYLGGIDVPAVVRYGHGFVQGADAAAAEVGADVEVKYWYSGAFWPTDEIKAKMDSWYAEGTEVVFAAGGGILYSCLAAANEGNGLVIGVDTDQGYIDERIITSAYKLIPTAVQSALNKVKAANGVFPADLAGKTTLYGATEGAVGIPTAEGSWRFNTFTVEEYEAMFQKIVAGEIVISDDINNHPTTSDRVVADYQN